MSVAEDRGAEWAPAPGSVARHNWPLPARCVWWLAHRPSLVALVALAAVVGVEIGLLVLAAAVTVIAVALAGWWRAHPRSFYPYGGRALLGLWRSLWAYGVRWRTAMMLSGLGGRFGGDEYVPRVVRVRAGRYVDRVTVRMVAGQSIADWGRRATRWRTRSGPGPSRCTSSAAAPATSACSSAASTPSPRSSPCPHPAPSTSPQCRSAAGRTAGPGPCASAARTPSSPAPPVSGKGSVIWSLIRALGPLIRDGLVRLWVLDPKGGMELAAGAPLFDRFVYDDPAAMADVLQDAVAVMQARAARLRGRTRLHDPTIDEPLITVVVDELAALTAYAERDDRRRINAALSLLLSQGRAVGVVVVAALQDPRKETLPFRDLFPTRIALAFAEAEQTDLVLGRGARLRGADCSRIPLTTPGIGWVWCDGEPEPVRVRAGWVTDTDIADLATTYTPGTPPDDDGSAS